ncbi:hypothetical protein V8C37DRAFT_364329 [Trichoderma ceciliae]
MAELLRSQDAYDLIRNIREWQSQQLNVHPNEYFDDAATATHNEIARLSSSLLALFEEVILALREQSHVSKDARISLERSCGALILWSDGYGIAQGRFNDTFDKSRKLRRTVFKNLSHIGRVLTERLVPTADIWSETLQLLCSSVESNIEDAGGVISEDLCRNSDDSSSDAGSAFSDDDIYEIAEDLRTDTCVLSGLDPLLKCPIFDLQLEDTVESYALSAWSPEKLFADKIENRFPGADAPLASHLGKTNYERYLRCQAARDAHESEEALPVTDQEGQGFTGTVIAKSKFHDSGIGTSLGLTSSYAETIMSYNHEGQSVRIPPLPKEAKEGLPFTCIACGRTVVITNNSAWKRHIYLDLQPYMCLDVSCPYSSTTFESREKWISHLALDHEMEPGWDSVQCLLCKEETGGGKMAVTRHFSKHLEEISLSALPVEVDSDLASENASELSDSTSWSEYEISRTKTPPSGFEFVPIGNPELTAACKAISRKRNKVVFVVPEVKVVGETTLTNTSHPVGHHIEQSVVKEAEASNKPVAQDEAHSTHINSDQGSQLQLPNSEDQSGSLAGPSIPRFVRKKRDTKVSTLAKHFEQLSREFSREFEKERQRDRKKLEASMLNRRRLTLTKSSTQAVVQVHDNVNESFEDPPVTSEQSTKQDAESQSRDTASAPEREEQEVEGEN